MNGNKNTEAEIELYSNGPLLPSGNAGGDKQEPVNPHLAPAKKIYYGQAIFTSVMAGSSNFMNSYLTKQDFAAVTLNFLPFIIVATAYKLLTFYWEGKEKGIQNRRPFMRVAFANFTDEKTGQVDWYYVRNILFRVFISTVSLYSAIKSIHFAILANINFGIISCCFIISIVINSTCGFFFFQERLNSKVIGGIVITLSGIIWISLAKGARVEVPKDLGEN